MSSNGDHYRKRGAPLSIAPENLFENARKYRVLDGEYDPLNSENISRLVTLEVDSREGRGPEETENEISNILFANNYWCNSASLTEAIIDGVTGEVKRKESLLSHERLGHGIMRNLERREVYERNSDTEIERPGHLGYELQGISELLWEIESYANDEMVDVKLGITNDERSSSGYRIVGYIQLRKNLKCWAQRYQLDVREIKCTMAVCGDADQGGGKLKKVRLLIAELHNGWPNLIQRIDEDCPLVSSEQFSQGCVAIELGLVST